MKREIRLACRSCDRDDHDGISEVALSAAIAQGWRDIVEVQTYAKACMEIPRGHGDNNLSVMDWFTHLGDCPECEESTDAR